MLHTSAFQAKTTFQEHLPLRFKDMFPEKGKRGGDHIHIRLHAKDERMNKKNLKP